ncbi:MAG TPA: DUF4337 family protein [Tepidisphaeraceae bacterium]|nr:DUF4337 family protein [Tepidisphaeraceae bacterium]
MEEFDSHAEHAHEQAHEAAHEARERWVTGVALTAAILAALAAITSLLSGHHEHEAMLEQVQAADQWSYYQAKSIKTLLREQRVEDLADGGQTVPTTLRKKVIDARRQQETTRRLANQTQDSSKFHDHLHMIFAGGVTLFQVAIAVAAISALTRRRMFWFVGIGLGVIALVFLLYGLAAWHHGEEPAAEAPEHPASRLAALF